MSDAERDLPSLTAGAWRATPHLYSSMRVLRFMEDGSGLFVYGYGQTIYATINCLWSRPSPGVLALTYLQSPGPLSRPEFTPDDANRHKEVDFKLNVGEFTGVTPIMGPYKYLLSIDFSRSPFPEGMQFPHEIPLVYYTKYGDPKI